jgi:hypothetical protein
MRKAALVFVREKFDFWIRLARWKRQFPLMKWKESCETPVKQPFLGAGKTVPPCHSGRQTGNCPYAAFPGDFRRKPQK